MSVFGVFLVRMQSECGKTRTRKTLNTDIFHAVSSQHFLCESLFWQNLRLSDCLSSKHERYFSGLIYALHLVLTFVAKTVPILHKLLSQKLKASHNITVHAADTSSKSVFSHVRKVGKSFENKAVLNKAIMKKTSSSSSGLNSFRVLIFLSINHISLKMIGIRVPSGGPFGNLGIGIPATASSLASALQIFF